MLPMTRARMTAINGQSVAELHFTDARGRRFAEREQNLSWSGELGSDNRIVAGRWWSPADYSKPLVSVSYTHLSRTPNCSRACRRVNCAPDWLK